MNASAVTVEGSPLDGHVVWTCEHASAAIPEWLAVSPADRMWFRTHWGHDRGAAALVRVLQERMGGPAVFAGYSRLVADVNRPPEHPDLCRLRVEGMALAHNQDLSEGERQRRVVEVHEPYHRQLDRVIQARRDRGIPTVLFSVHTFTSLYEGTPRTLDLGVLFDETDAGAADVLLCGLQEDGRFSVAPNAPWSGMDGLIYSVARHGRAHGLPYLELEVRDELLTGPDAGGPADPVPIDAAGVSRVAEAVARALSAVVRRQLRGDGGVS